MFNKIKEILERPKSEINKDISKEWNKKKKILGKLIPSTHTKDISIRVRLLSGERSNETKVYIFKKENNTTA